jgi:hypothetical protein
MIEPICDCCKKPMTEFGALYFGPPAPDGYVRKRHICVKCARLVDALFKDP